MYRLEEREKVETGNERERNLVKVNKSKMEVRKRRYKEQRE